MYIGIYINNSFISSASVNQEEEVLLIKNENSRGQKKFLTPLKVYIEDNFAYLGDQIDFLTANDYELKYGYAFLDHLARINTTVYKDNTGVCWNALSLISIFLKKLKANIQMFEEHTLQGAVVTLPTQITPAVIEALKTAFEIAQIPLCGVIDISKASLLGYGICGEASKVKAILHYNLDVFALSIGVLTIDEENYSETLLFETNKKKGEHELQEFIEHFLVKKYEHITNREIKKNKKNRILLQKIVNKMLSTYSSESKLYIRVLCSFDDPMAELIVTRAQIDAIITKYISQTLFFMKKSLEKAGVAMHNINEIVITGTSSILNHIEVHLRHVFDQQEIKIYNHTVDQIITRGAAIHANNAVERQISASLLTETKQEVITAPLETIQTDKEDTPNQMELTTLVNTMHINAGCNV